MLLWKRLTGELIPLRELLMMKRPGPDVRLFYRQSASLVNFLVGLEGWERFFEFAESLTAGSLDATIGNFYPYKTAEELDKAWRESLGG